MWGDRTRFPCPFGCGVGASIELNGTNTYANTTMACHIKEKHKPQPKRLEADWQDFFETQGWIQSKPTPALCAPCSSAPTLAPLAFPAVAAQSSSAPTPRPFAFPAVAAQSSSAPTTALPAIGASMLVPTGLF